MNKLRRLWLGELPLDEAFWTWAITGGLGLNLASSAMFLVLITTERPWAALLVGYGPTIPYNIMAVVGVWRSAARYRGPGAHADLARLTVMIVMLVLTLT